MYVHCTIKANKWRNEKKTIRTVNALEKNIQNKLLFILRRRDKKEHKSKLKQTKAKQIKKRLDEKTVKKKITTGIKRNILQEL